MKKSLLVVALILLIPFMFFASEVSETVTDILESGFVEMKADVAVGSPVTVGNKTVIPLFEANTSFGAGLGGPEGVAYGGGAGGGLDLLPYSVLIISEEGVEVVPVSNKVPFLQQLVGVLPEVLPMVMELMGMGEMPSETEEVKPAEPEKEQKATQSVEKAIEHLSEMMAIEQNEETFRGAKKEIDSLITKAPNNARLNALQGYVTLRLIEYSSPLQQMKMAMDAQRQIEKALSLDPDDYFANLANGWLNLYSPMGNIQAGIGSFKKAIKARPNSVEPYFGIVEAMTKAGMTKEAQDYAGVAKKIAPDEAEYIDSLLKTDKE